MADLRKPLQIYPRLSPRVKCRQSVVGNAIDFSASYGAQTASEHWDIADTDLSPFIQDVIGWSVSGGQNIKRSTPAQHAQLSYLYASRIASVEGIASTGQRFAPAGSTASFKLLRVGILYENPPYNIKSDALTTIEWQRYLMIEDYESNTEFFQRRRGCFQFPPTAGVVANKAIPDSHGSSVLVRKDRITEMWIQVPDAGLFSAGGRDKGGRALKIESALGCVNRLFWRGYPPGTLLFENWKPMPRGMPVPGEVIGRLGEVPRAWDAKLIFSFFDPPTNPAINNAPRGHNLVPHPTDGFWYRAYLKGGADNSSFWRYPDQDFDTIFQMN